MASDPSQFAKPALQLMPQLPLEHVAVPFVELHTLPQEPQLPVLVWVFTSQPFATLPSQFAKPALQVMPHALPEQNAVPFVPLHALPQLPQWLAVFVVFTSQPFAALPSQLPNPALQVMPQFPPPQVAVPFVELHTLPQEPQLLVLFDVLISQPLACAPSQFAKPALHEMLQLPAVHDGVPFAVPQALPQVPQFVVVVRFVSQPFATLPSQLPQPALHVMVHDPALQAGVPLFELHTLPQAPQFDVVVRLVSQPFATLPSQFPSPGLQLMPLHTPAAHVGVPPVELHALPHVPQ